MYPSTIRVSKTGKSHTSAEFNGVYHIDSKMSNRRPVWRNRRNVILWKPGNKLYPNKLFENSSTGAWVIMSKDPDSGKECVRFFSYWRKTRIPEAGFT